MKSVTETKRIVTLGVLTASAVVLSWIEFIIPFNIGIPGIKLGLANIATLFALYYLGAADACGVSAVRIVISGFAFGGVTSILYSLSGAVLALTLMIILKKTGFSVITVSAIGGVAHNAGQLICAIFVTETPLIITYLPILAISGIITGAAVGTVSAIIIKRSLRN